jgi:hypothetical protein
LLLKRASRIPFSFWGRSYGLHVSRRWLSLLRESINSRREPSHFHFQYLPVHLHFDVQLIGLPSGIDVEALAEALDALSARPLEVVIRLPGPGPDGARLERRLINAVLATDNKTVINIYREEPVRDDAVPPAPPDKTAASQCLPR